MRLSLTVGALLASSAVAFVPPMPASRTRATKLASALIPDNVRKSLTSDQLKTLEAAAEKATKAAAADLDPWFGEAEAEDSSFAPFTTLEAMTGKPVPVPSASGAQDFLEANPYYDQTGIPLNTYKNKEPHTGKIVSVKRMVGPKATGETCHIIIDHGGAMPFWEGQSYGVVPPGINPKNGKPNNVRLYSIASTRYGDDMKGQTASLCVRRATYWCPELKADDPAKKGICSNFLCDAKPGDKIALAGPTGKVMLIPEKTPEADIIMIATGTGIAPYRTFVRRLFVEDTPARKAFKGLAWLFLGVANTDSLLYDEEWQAVKKEYPNNFRVDYALSREQENKKGGKMYIQDKMEEYADEIFDRLSKGGHIYFCGLKGMMPGIQETLERVAGEKGIDWKEMLEGLKKNHQWHVEVY